MATVDVEGLSTMRRQESNSCAIEWCMMGRHCGVVRHLVMRRRSRWLGEPRRRRTDGLRDWDELQLLQQWLWSLHRPLLTDLQHSQHSTMGHF